MNFCNYCYTRTDACSDCHAAELAAKDKEIEKLRIQLAACGIAALCNTRKSIEEQGIDKDNPYYSASYADVCDAVNREIEHREEIEELKIDLSVQWGRNDALGKEIEGLKAQIAAMRRCEICKHWDNDFSISNHCINCANTTTLPNWELAK